MYTLGKKKASPGLLSFHDTWDACTVGDAPQCGTGYPSGLIKLLPMPSMPHCDDSSSSLDNTGAEYQDRCTGTGTGHPLLLSFILSRLQLYSCTLQLDNLAGFAYCTAALYYLPGIPTYPQVT